MRIIAIDPSSTSVGFAVFDDNFPVHCFSYKPKGKTLVERMVFVMSYVEGLIDTFEPDILAIETPYLGRNRSTAMKMGMIFGMICGAIAKKGYPEEQVIQIHPMTAKKAAGQIKVRKRGESKQIVMDAMKKEFPHLSIDNDDASDALAVGLAATEKIKERDEREPN